MLRSINRGFLSWLDGRREPGRPFFVFLNYLDAHAPYKVPSEQNSPLRPEAPDASMSCEIIYEQVDRDRQVADATTLLDACAGLL